MTLALLAAIVFAQSTVSLQIGKDKEDSVARAKREGATILSEVEDGPPGPRDRAEDFAQVLYNRGLVNSMLGTEAIRPCV